MVDMFKLQAPISTIVCLCLALSILDCIAAPKDLARKISVVPVSEVNWEKLNPARGDKSPQAGTLWGDRKGEVETGFLAKFVDGFSSPPHIHNVSYRAIVIDGLIHNDDPKAENMWMPKQSFWTQPAGEAHITSAKGKLNIALVEIDKGPYLVRPVAQKFDNGERPYNIHASNILWSKNGEAQTAPMWRNSKGDIVGSLVKFKGKTKVSSKNARVVVIDGSVDLPPKNQRGLQPGSLITIKDASAEINCKEASSCTLYVKSEKGFNL